MSNRLHVCIPPSSCFWVFVLFIYVVIHNSLPSLCDTENRYLTCVAPFHCGDTALNLSYPFWGSTRPSYCGHPRFGLSCSGKAPVLSVMSIGHRVIEIDYKSQSLKVARMDYWDDICPAYAANSALDFTLFNFTGDTYTLLLFYGCPTSTSVPYLTVTPPPTACTDDSIGRSHEQYSLSNSSNTQYSSCSNRTTAKIIANGTSSNDSALGNLFSCPNKTKYSVNYYELKPTTNWLSREGFWSCELSVKLPIVQSAARTIGNDSTPENLVAALRAGFGLQWRLNNATCERCELSGGACGSNPNTGEFTCYCKTGSYSTACLEAVPPKSTWWVRLVIGILVGLAVIIIMVIFIYYYLKKTLMSKQVEEILRAYDSQIPRRYRYVEVKKMTALFKNKIGQGEYSVVYKGKLSDGKDVAVKLLNKSEGDMKAFINEVASISKTSHVNVVTLLGFCFEWNKRVLIYEFMPKGSLEKYICHRGSSEKDCQLDWNKLHKIVLGIARGLEYLHCGCNTKILHFDIKPQNVLLDEDFCPKISDFGLSKQCKINESHISMTDIRGTQGFIAPEVYSRNLVRVTHKSDVYSFGMLILEMVGERKKPEDLSKSSEEKFSNWIYNDLQKRQSTNVYWATMTEEEEEIAKRLIIVGLSCIQTIPSERPSMTEVIEMLGRRLDRLQIPPKPSLLL